MANTDPFLWSVDHVVAALADATCRPPEFFQSFVEYNITGGALLTFCADLSVLNTELGIVSLGVSSMIVQLVHQLRARSLLYAKYAVSTESTSAPEKGTPAHIPQIKTEPQNDELVVRTKDEASESGSPKIPKVRLPTPAAPLVAPPQPAPKKEATNPSQKHQIENENDYNASDTHHATVSQPMSKGQRKRANRRKVASESRAQCSQLTPENLPSLPQDSLSHQDSGSQLFTIAAAPPTTFVAVCNGMQTPSPFSKTFTSQDLDGEALAKHQARVNGITSLSCPTDMITAAKQSRADNVIDSWVEYTRTRTSNHIITWQELQASLWGEDVLRLLNQSTIASDADLTIGLVSRIRDLILEAGGVDGARALLLAVTRQQPSISAADVKMSLFLQRLSACTLPSTTYGHMQAKETQQDSHGVTHAGSAAPNATITVKRRSPRLAESVRQIKELSPRIFYTPLIISDKSLSTGLLPLMQLLTSVRDIEEARRYIALALKSRLEQLLRRPRNPSEDSTFWFVLPRDLKMAAGLRKNDIEAVAERSVQLLQTSETLMDTEMTDA